MIRSTLPRRRSSGVSLERRFTGIFQSTQQKDSSVIRCTSLAITRPSLPRRRSSVVSLDGRFTGNNGVRYRHDWTMPTFFYPTRRSSGLTLIELLVTISILAILMTIGVPAFTNTMVRYQMDSVASDLASFASLARSEAVSRGQNVVICKSSSPNAANASLACGGNWEDGWIMFEDIGKDGGFTDGADTVLRRRSTTSWITITSEDTTYITRVTYRSDGRPTTAGTFNLKDNSGGGVGETEVVISSSGRIRTTKN